MANFGITIRCTRSRGPRGLKSGSGTNGTVDRLSHFTRSSCDFQMFLEFVPGLLHQWVAVTTSFEHAGFDAAGAFRHLQRGDLLQKGLHGLGVIKAERQRGPSRENHRACAGNRGQGNRGQACILHSLRIGHFIA